jgi:hypothetical protein
MPQVTAGASFCQLFLGRDISGLKELTRLPTALVSFDFAFRQFPDTFVWTDSDHHQLLTCEPNTDCWIALQRKIKAAVTNRERVALKT